jgi:hypothetical protein
MKMPDTVEDYLFAPCGMNCLVCYVHLKKIKPCGGCLGADANKPDRCKACAIKLCALARGYTHCHECPEFPCARINNLEKSYRKRYATSLVGNSLSVRDIGMVVFQKLERIRWSCKKCGGVISLHDGVCSECGGKGDSYHAILKNKGKDR